jgi:acyl carrier protein
VSTAAEHLLEGLHAEALDCLQTSIAVVADEAQGSGAHALLGCRLGWDTRRDLDHRLAEAAELLGVRATERRDVADGPALRALLDGGERLYVAADAYDMPWIPYAGHRHMAHSFLVERADEQYVVLDAYHNDTEWGPARPGAWTLSSDELDGVLAQGGVAVRLEAPETSPRLDEAAVLAENAERAQAAEIEDYLAAVRKQIDEPEGVDRLVLDVWLLARERLLHATWLDGLAGRRSTAERAEQLAQDWLALATRSYVAMRRSRRGPSRMEAIVDDLEAQLAADREYAEQAAAEPSAERTDDPRQVVLESVADVLPLDGEAIDDETPLRDLPGFDSFRLVEVLERVEERLGVELPERIDAADLQTVGAVTRLFASSPEPALR